MAAVAALGAAHGAAGSSVLFGTQLSSKSAVAAAAGAALAAFLVQEAKAQQRKGDLAEH